ncbi:hypothetical protein [Streptomyces sp. NRRL F-5755]|uniref:hypothetical protein n=1 Tax=Streptomyces sp. NRRL F-5755 TaxID=1519475 RepID=UPI0018FE4AEE|nr:hypothetical protein [Streptomyces sp. NRRL F-5755]
MPHRHVGESSDVRLIHTAVVVREHTYPLGTHPEAPGLDAATRSPNSAATHTYADDWDWYALDPNCLGADGKIVWCELYR